MYSVIIHYKINEWLGLAKNETSTPERSGDLPGDTPPRIESRHSEAYRQHDDAENAESCTPGLSRPLRRKRTRATLGTSRAAV